MVGVQYGFLLEKAIAGEVVTTEEVVAELERRFYDLKITPWVKLHVPRIAPTRAHFDYLQAEVLVKCKGIIDPDITNTTYADPMLLAVSGCDGLVLVTDEGEIDEQPNTNPNNLKLPNHCKKIKVACIYGRYAWTELLRRTGLVIEKFRHTATTI